jgi:hypothetical protein
MMAKRGTATCLACTAIYSGIFGIKQSKYGYSRRGFKRILKSNNNRNEINRPIVPYGRERAACFVEFEPSLTDEV